MPQQCFHSRAPINRAAQWPYLSNVNFNSSQVLVISPPEFTALLNKFNDCKNSRHPRVLWHGYCRHRQGWWRAAMEATFFPPLSFSLSSAASCWCSRTMLFFPPSPASVEASARPRREKMGRARAASPICPTLSLLLKIQKLRAPPPSETIHNLRSDVSFITPTPSSSLTPFGSVAAYCY